MPCSLHGHFCFFFINQKLFMTCVLHIVNRDPILQYLSFIYVPYLHSICKSAVGGIPALDAMGIIRSINRPLLL